MTEPERVRIVAATSTCLTIDQATELGITLVPLRIGVDGRDYRDMIDLGPAELYRLLRQGVLPTTASPAVGDYAAAFDAAPGPVLCLTVGSRISAMDAAARLAAEATGDRRVEVVETGTAAGGLRLVALAAARLAGEGLPLETVSERVQEICGRVEMSGMLETVEFLARSGRVPEIARWGTSVLRVRPVVRFDAGSGRLAALVRSPLRGLDEMRKLVRRGADRQGGGPCGEGVVCTVFHGDAPGLAEELERGLREDLPAAELSISEMTAAMAIHVGPGVVGEAFYVDPAATGGSPPA